MGIVVQKYGGTSVGTPERIKRVAERIALTHAAGAQVVVVVSAMGDSTDELLDLARAVTLRPPESYERELDVLLSAGERVAMALLSMALSDVGVPAISFTGSQSGIITDPSHTRARILEIRPARVLEQLATGKVVIVAGFQGVSREKEITTLGRGGSDTTAVALATTLSATCCEVYTDVDGIYSADPRKVHEARRYEQLPVDLVGEMAALGAQVMHPRSIEIARAEGLDLIVRSAHPPADGASNSAGQGTQIVSMASSRVPDGKEKSVTPGLELPKVVAVVARAGLVGLRFGAEVRQDVLADLDTGAVVVHALEVDALGVLFVAVDAREACSFVERWQSRSVDSSKPRLMAMVSIIGYQLHANATIPGKALEVLQGAGFQVSGLTCHPQSITVWISGRDHALLQKAADDATRCLHDAFLERILERT